MGEITLEEWAGKSRQGEVCGILACYQPPTIRCRWYCRDHSFVLQTPAHPEPSLSKQEQDNKITDAFVWGD